MTYTHGHHESVLRSHKWRTVDNSAAYLAPHLTSATSVLDLGCGPGTITADIGRRVAPGRVLGIDASAAVIDEARRDAGGGPNVEFSVGDLYALEMDDHTFDVVHAHQVLQHLPDPVRALQRLRRIAGRTERDGQRQRRGQGRDRPHVVPSRPVDEVVSP
jgi:ubiquinone/menaquinone biosynthesis C-methylase UbiE